jgi:HPt (histidine-containing phosphotransfer) domain-containing protein
MTKKIESLVEDYETQLKEKEESYAKIEKMLKDEILEYKEKEIRLLSENDTLKSNSNILKK